VLGTSGFEQRELLDDEYCWGNFKMFQVNLSENRLRKLDEKRFSDLNLREREHLQEWLANQPDALGEELLIIQKEFDGFADTRERLDLLALDKDGFLVVIENKLDDSGRCCVAGSEIYRLRFQPDQGTDNRYLSELPRPLLRLREMRFSEFASLSKLRSWTR
jgi:RecB family endonuclease NucS